jgi:ABC-type glutathione transport system ATPase component
MDARFRLRRISKSYGDSRQRAGKPLAVLTAVDLDILDGRVQALVGRSGSGKSTLARIVMGFAAPDSGEVLYRDRPLGEAPLPAFRRSNQLVLQNPLLAVNPLFTVGQIIGEPLRILNAVPPRLDASPAEGIDGIATATEKIAAAPELLELPGALWRRLPHELSGGELQRVVLARALVLEPEFLVLDEPFSALDDLGAMRILRQCRTLFQRLRLGVLLISHHPRHVNALADRVVVLEKGMIVAGGAF